MQLRARHRRQVVEEILDIEIFSKMNLMFREKQKLQDEVIKQSDFNCQLIDGKIDSQKKHIEDKTPILQDEWFEIQRKLYDVEGFYRNYKQCDMQTEAKRMVNHRQTEYSRADIHESWTVLKEPTDAKDTIKVVCPVGHEFTHHFHAWTDKDIGCLACARKEDSTLYFLDFGEFIKIGITVKTPEKRFPEYEFDTILTINNIGWGHAHYIEQQIIKNNKEFATEPELLVGNGSTECFTSAAKQSILEELKQWQ